MTQIALVIDPPARDLGDGFSVRRALPNARRRMVGPFIFVDEMGPAEFAPGHGLDVRPHPHIGLATVTWLFEGEITHRDSLGVVRSILPGAVNWMVAGRGIVHSERTGDDFRASGGRLWGMQTWVALPEEAEEAEPAFAHHAAETLPSIVLDGARRTLILGTAFGARSPVSTFSPIFYIAVEAEDGATVHLPDEHEERAVYVAAGAIEAGGERFGAGKLIVLEPGAGAHFRAHGPTRAMLLGGAPVGPRHIEWNFVSSRPERITRAKDDWRHGRFATVPGDDEFIPLPPEPPGRAQPETPVADVP